MTGRVFHTSDWHLGRQIGRHRRDTEVDAVLDEIIAIAEDYTPDLIVHSGDLFDSPRPSLDDMRRAAQALRRLGTIAPVVVVAGNHDTTHVLTFLEYVLNDMGAREGDQSRVRFATDAHPDRLLLAEYPTRNGELTLRIGALPYLHPNRFTYDFADPALTTATYAERMRTVQAEVYRRLTAGRGPRDVLIYAAHLFIEGALPSYSERRISLSTEYAAAAADLPDVAYGALGHIHKPQPVGRSGFPAYYAGSPLQMDFGETGDTKSVVLAEIGPDTNARIELEPLTAGRRLVRLEGTLEQIAHSAARVGDAWVKAVVNVDAFDPSLPATSPRCCRRRRSSTSTSAVPAQHTACWTGRPPPPNCPTSTTYCTTTSPTAAQAAQPWTAPWPPSLTCEPNPTPRTPHRAARRRC